MRNWLPAILLFASALAAGCSRGQSPVAAASAPPAVEFAGEWGTQGQEPGQLDMPVGLAVDTASRVYLPDRGTGLLQKFTLEGVPLLSFEAPALSAAASVAVDVGGGIYVADPRAGQIHVYFPEGDPLRILRIAPQPRYEGAFIFSVDGSDGDLFVPNPAAGRIQVLTAKGQLVRSWAVADGGAKESARPIASVIGPNGFVYTGDAVSGQILKFDRNGERAPAWSDAAAAGNLQGLVASADSIFVLCGGNPRLRILTLDGKQQLTDDLGGRLDSASGGLYMALAPDGELLILDAAGHRVLRFRVHLEAK